MMVRKLWYYFYFYPDSFSHFPKSRMKNNSIPLYFLSCFFLLNLAFHLTHTGSIEVREEEKAEIPKVIGCLGDNSDTHQFSNWHGLLANWTYFERADQLPEPLNQIGGTGIFYFEGGMNAVDWFVNRELKPPEDICQMYLYLSFYMMANPLNTRVFVYPALLDDYVGDYFKKLEVTAAGFEWMEVLVELDSDKLRANFEWIGLHLVGFGQGEYFLIDKIALIDGHMDILDETSFDAIPFLCPEIAIPTTTTMTTTTTTTTTTTENTSEASTDDGVTTTEGPFITTQPPQFTDDSVITTTHKGSSAPGYLWPLTATLIFIALSIAVMIFMWRRLVRLAKRRQRDLSDSEIFAFRHGSISIDPNDTQACIYSLPYDQYLEIPMDRIEVDESKPLGAGHFGIVKRGWLTMTDGGKEVVAVKTVSPEVDVDTFKALLSEIKVMSYLGWHENILLLLGACTTSIRKRQVLALVELCEMGDLKSFLKEHDPTKVYSGFNELSAQNIYGKQSWDPRGMLFQDLLRFCVGIANGMKYLTKKNVIHGDLACRNILLTENMVIKISDFGLSKQILNYEVYHKKGKVALPLKWMSIEAIRSMKFSIKSDVWSFGVVLFEIFSLGEDPYAGLQFGPELIKDLVAGRRLDKPEWATDAIYALMLSCWEKDPGKRPMFKDIHNSFDRMLTDTLLPTASGQAGIYQKVTTLAYLMRNDHAFMFDGIMSRRRSSQPIPNYYH